MLRIPETSAYDDDRTFHSARYSPSECKHQIMAEVSAFPSFAAYKLALCCRWNGILADSD